MSKKNPKPGLIGRKIGMTQIFTKAGEYKGCTVIEVGPCVVTQVKGVKDHGYEAIQVGFCETEFRRVNRPMRGYFEKKGLKAFRYTREFRVENSALFKNGQQLDVTAFELGDLVDVTGISKGKGFQGVIKRHHKAGGPAAHGSTFHRSTGSIGQRTFPGKVFKLMKLPGHMGDRQVTVRNLRVLQIDAERNLLVVQGAIPGGKNAIVLVGNRSEQFSKRLAVAGAPATEAQIKETSA